jgi:hypothetical protein
MPASPSPARDQRHSTSKSKRAGGGFRELKTFARQWPTRTWAIEGCNGVGKYLAQRLVADGERVLDVSTRRATLVRVFAGGDHAPRSGGETISGEVMVGQPQKMHVGSSSISRRRWSTGPGSMWS